MIFHFFVSFLFDSFLFILLVIARNISFLLAKWRTKSMLILVLRVFNCCCLLKYECLGCRFFFSISRKNCKIIFHWFHFSRIIFFLEKRKTNYTYISSYHASKFLGIAPKINLWDWLLIKYFNLQDAYTLSVILNNIFTQKIRKGAWHQTSLGGGGSKRKHSHVRIKRQKWGIIV